jgi:acetolactate synthase-1/2/3 large subunit
VLLTEAGNSFAWGNGALRFHRPGLYRTSMRFGAMGHATTGVLGAAWARGGKAVAVWATGRC